MPTSKYKKTSDDNLQQFSPSQVLAAAKEIQPHSPNPCTPLDNTSIFQRSEYADWPGTTHFICKPSRLYSLPYKFNRCRDFHA
jgi:5-methylcytosine-specific restriction endonuclease McrA